MRTINYIVLHCTAGPQDQPTSEILSYWKNVMGWTNPGYHFEINTDGFIEELFPIEKIANGVAGHNANSIHISYKGGVDNKGRPFDNRTDAQKAAQIHLIYKLKVKFPHAKICGHRDFPGVTKACPSFDVNDWLKTIKL
ncbi:N-acetylmuramoyl-L-alanine amidase [Mucilaginibacter pedocola]|uniref:N-acetylmuramoyl-L-alanine amidase n=1 Tax=Mucilaginibacter pedocola TaxID=1792845 RepID=A0A1S9P8H3_9SPHI|nr:N-acetylmuramoyl-L-alanine amidase [Mucilaginibacter pedocola]OOQ57137.1 N-acetylmuramoyl-L-alanine amidase [Mucilaginibacter pedocola]